MISLEPMIPIFMMLPVSSRSLAGTGLRIDRRSTQLFRPLVDGTVDAVRAQVTQPFGVGGLTLPGGGFPVPSDVLAAELVRLRTDFTFLRRSFIADMQGRDPWIEVPRLQAHLADLRRADPAEAETNRQRLLAVTRPAVPVLPARVGVGPAA